MDKITERAKIAKQRANIIRDFAKKMGYTVSTDNYKHSTNKRPIYIMELLETYDSVYNPYCWAWYTDTWEEIIEP